MTQEERKEAMERALAVSNEEIAKAMIEASASELGKLLVQRNNEKAVERQIKRLGLWPAKKQAA